MQAIGPDVQKYPFHRSLPIVVHEWIQDTEFLDTTSSCFTYGGVRTLLKLLSRVEVPGYLRDDFMMSLKEARKDWHSQVDWVSAEDSIPFHCTIQNVFEELLRILSAPENFYIEFCQAIVATKMFMYLVLMTEIPMIFQYDVANAVRDFMHKTKQRELKEYAFLIANLLCSQIPN